MRAQDHRPRRNRIAEDLLKTTWDGKPRLDSWMVRHLGAKDSARVRVISRLTIMAMAARALVPGCPFGVMPILRGPQGCGKSAALRALAGPYFVEGFGPIGSREFVQAASGAWLVEVAELEALRRVDWSDLKAFITANEDRFRPPYAETMVRVPRTAVFFGTTSGNSSLADHLDGSRRFWVVDVNQADPLGLAGNRLQLFAEALHWLESGNPVKASYLPTPEEEAVLDRAEGKR